MAQAAAGGLFYFPGTGVWRVLVDKPDAIDLSDDDPKVALRGGGKSKEIYPLTALVAAQVWMAPQALTEKQLPNGSKLVPGL